MFQFDTIHDRLNGKRRNIWEAFFNYATNFDINDQRVSLKVKHTHKVAEIAEAIARSIPGMSEEEIQLCWLLGILHDIGRFEQLKRYNTFIDRKSVDHAELGADLLFKEKLIERFWISPITDMPAEKELGIIELAIWQHNKLTLPENLAEDERTYCNILRDADKIDIFRVAQEIPFEVRMTRQENEDGRPAREEVMRCVREHRCVPRMTDGTSIESHIAGCAMAFELVYPYSKKLARQQGYLDQLLSYEPKGTEQKTQMEELRKELAKVC